MRQARTRSNPFETIRNGIFQNRAAVKMANMEYLCDMMFTSPTDLNGVSVLPEILCSMLRLATLTFLYDLI